MKKSYINPETDIVLVTMQTLIAASTPVDFNPNVNDDESIEPEDMLSRRKNKDVWDDEEEENDEK